MKLVLIGGGDIGRNNTKYETAKIDNYVVKLSGKAKPNLLFIGLASSFSDSYYKYIKDIYSNLGCETGKISNKTLKNIDVVKRKIDEADIIYIGAGDTLKLLNLLKEYKMDDMIRSACNRGCVVVGISAGAIALCKSGVSDYEIMNNISNNYVLINGLGILDIMFVPHYNTDDKKTSDVKNILNGTKKVAYCLENCTALSVIEDEISTIKCNDNAKAYKVYYENKDYIIDEI